MTNAIVYCRISQDRSGEGLGVDRQEEDCRNLAKLRGWDVVAVLVDNDVSAAGKRVRKGFDETLALVDAGNAQVIVAWALDRLTRNRRDQLRLMEVCEKRAATIALVRGGEIDLTTPNGRMMADFLSTIARGEIEVRGDRIRRAREQSALAGKFKGGIRPFGFEKDGITLQPAEAAEIDKATNALLAGASLRSVVKAINDAGVLASKGNVWSTTEMRNMLMRARNAGLSVYNDEVVGKGQWPAIVSVDAWRGVTRILQDSARRTSPGNSVRWLGSGIYRCGAEGCDETMICSRSTRSMKPRYRCRTRKHVGRDVERLDEFVEELIIERLSREDAVDLLRDDEQGDDPADLHVQILALRQRLDDQALLHAEGAIDKRQLLVGSKAIRADLADLEQRQATAGRRNVFVGIVGSPDVRATWESYKDDLGRKRAILDALLTITILPGRHGRTADGGYFRPELVGVDWKR